MLLQQTDKKPLVIKNELVNAPGADRSVIPAKQISRKRSQLAAKKNQHTPGDLLEDLKMFLRPRIRPASPDPSQLWVDWNHTTVTSSETIVPDTCDRLLRIVFEIHHEGDVYSSRRTTICSIGWRFHASTNQGWFEKGCYWLCGVSLFEGRMGIDHHSCHLRGLP